MLDVAGLAISRDLGGKGAVVAAVVAGHAVPRATALPPRRAVPMRLDCARDAGMLENWTTCRLLDHK